MLDEGVRFEKREIRVRNWLHSNKIYFEIGSSLVFGVASIFVAVAANDVSKRQLEISKIQLEPLIYIGEKYSAGEGGSAANTILEVNNTGAPVYGFSVDAKTFYAVVNASEEIWIPVEGVLLCIFRAG
jgi:hypothetical protein